MPRVPLHGPLALSPPELSGPFSVPLGTLHVDPARFQVRNPKALSYSRGVLAEIESVDHTARLAEAIVQGESLDPILVWREPSSQGGRLCVVDGFHRMEAFSDAGLSPDDLVLVQEILVSSDTEARSAALEINRRDKLRMNPKEAQDAYWRGLLCVDISGSTRQRSVRYGVSKGTVDRMDRKKGAVLSALRKEAAAQRVPFSKEFIRANAPAWRDIFKWELAQQGEEIPSKSDVDDAERYRRGKAKLKRALTKQFGERLLRNRTMGREALEEVLMELFGDDCQRRLKTDPFVGARAEVNLTPWG